MAITTSNPQGAIGSGNVNTITLSYTATAGTSLLLVALATRGASDITGLTITYNGVGLTSFGSIRGSTNGNRIDYWYMVNPPTGSAYNIVADWGNNVGTAIQAVCLLGTTGTPTDVTPNTGNATGGTQAVVTTSGDIAICLFQHVSTTTLSGDTTLNSQLQVTGSNLFTVRTSYAMATSTSTTLTFSSPSSARFGYITFCVAAAGGGGGPTYDGKFFQLF